MALSNLPSQQAITCPGCGMVVICRDSESSYFACQSCNSFFRYDDNDDAPEVIRRFYPSNVYMPALPIGTKGRLEDKEFTVIGFMVKQDVKEGVSWREYLLHSPGEAEQYVLSEYDGHWTFIWKIDTEGFDIFNVGTRFNPTYEIRTKTPFRTYDHYTTYKFILPFALGEFNWNLLDDEDNVSVEEYVCAPESITSEETFDTKHWYKGKYVDRQEIATAFGVLLSDLPPRAAPGILEVPNYHKEFGPLWRFTLLAVALVILTQMLVSLGKPSGPVFTGAYVAVRDSTSWGAFPPIVTEAFEIKQSGAVNIDMTTNVDNDWMEISVSLVNDKTGKTYEFTKAVEMYHGYEDGETWSEGSSEESGLFSGVPKGTYHLNIYPYSELKSVVDVRVAVEQNTIVYSNIIWMLLALLAYPLIQYMRKSAHNSYLWGE